MRKMIYILALALCGSLSSCRTQKEAGITAISDNPYLTHYIAATSDSIGISNSIRQQAYPNQGEQNLERQQKDVNPNKTTDTPWGDLLRDILQGIFSKNH